MGNSRIFGYDKKDCRLVINESEAKMVRLIFEEYATGKYSVRKIEDILFSKGYRGRSGTRIHHNTISGIIQNPKYKGFYCGNKVKVIDYRTKEQRFLPEEDWVMYKDKTGEVVPAIVSEELWDKCNEIFRARSATVKSREHSLKDKSVFTGKIFCAADDKAYWRTSYSNSVSQGKPIYQWICSEKKRMGAKACASFSILEADLYKMLSGHFKDIAENIEEYVADFLKIYRETDTSANVQRELDALRTRLDKEKAKREKLLDAYTESLISKAEFKERNDASNITISELEEDIYAVEKKSMESEDYVKELENIERYFKEMYSPDRDMTREEVDEMVVTLIDRINVIPRNKECMKLEIKLKTGANHDYTYVRGRSGNGCRSGHISKKMIDAYKQGINS